MKRILMLTGGLLLSTSVFLFAQKTTLSGGGNGNGSGGNVSYSIGQTVYQTNSGSSGSTAAAGVQQPYEISTGIGEYTELEMKLYPNPTTDVVEVWMADKKLKAVYRLYNAAGALLQTGNVADHVSIQMKALPSATYFLSVEAEKASKTFTIIKNQ